MNYNFDFDEAETFDGTQSVTDEQIDQFTQPLPAILPFHTQVQGHAMTLPTPPDSSESSVTPPPKQPAYTAAPKKSRAKSKKQPKQKAASATSSKPKKPKNSAPRRTPPHIAGLTNEEILKLPAVEAKKVMGERLLEFLLDYRECDLTPVTRDKGHSRIAHAAGRALQARADAQGRTYAELRDEFEQVSRAGRDRREKAAQTAAKKRSVADAGVDDGEEMVVKKARKTPAATTRAPSEESEVETARSESTMRDLGYSSATTGGLQPYVSPYDHETQQPFDYDPIFNLAPTANRDLIWNSVLPFNARHDEYAACIDHSCADGNGFSRLCSEEYLASIGLSGATNNPYVNNDDADPFWRPNWTINGAASSATNTAPDQMTLPTHSHIGTQTHDWNALDAAADALLQDLTREAIDAQISHTSFLTDGDIDQHMADSGEVVQNTSSFIYGVDNFTMMATDQVSQAQGVRSDLAMGVPSGGAISSQHMVGPIVGTNEFEAHRPEEVAVGIAQEMSHDEALDMERKRGFRYGAFDTVSEIDAFDFDGALYGDAEDFFGGPPLFE